VLVVMIAMLVVVDWFYLFRHGRDGRLKPGSVTEVPQ
jgi:hypothetical protein